MNFPVMKVEIATAPGLAGRVSLITGSTSKMASVSRVRLPRPAQPSC